MILILAEDEDVSDDQVQCLLQKRGVPFLRFNNAPLSGPSAGLDRVFNGLPIFGNTRVNGSEYPLTDFSGAWVTVVGRRVLAAEILSQRGHRQTGCRPHRLP